MRWSIGTKIGISFGIALALLIVIGAVSYDSLTKLIASAELVRHTHLVLGGLAGVQQGITDAETGQRGYIITGQSHYLDSYQDSRNKADAELRKVRELTVDNPRQQERLNTLEPLVRDKFTELQDVLNVRQAKAFSPASQNTLIDRGKILMDGIRKGIGDMEQEEQDLLGKRAADEDQSAARTKQIIIAGSLSSVLFLGIVGFVLSQNIVVPLRDVSTAAGRIAAGDLSIELSPDSRRDEVGVLANSFAEMASSLGQVAKAAESIAAGDLTVELKPKSEKDALGKAFAGMRERLRHVTKEIQESVNILFSSAQQIVATTNQVASGAAQTATAVAETTTTVQEVKQTAQLSSEKAKYVSESAQKVAQVSQSGKKAVADSVELMKQIQQQMESIAESIVRLSEQSQAIGEIMATVADLSEQSNLLAVNAAIEAAKAGEQGKGFAVVAQEIRNLADQSKQATAQVRGILSDIQKATNAAVMATEQGSKAVEAGVKQSVQAGESVEKLAESITEAAQAATQIAASSQQQTVGMDQMALAMESIKAASAQNVASTKQTESAARAMEDLGRKLKELVSLYKV